MEPLHGRHVVVGVAGSIAAYRACDLIRELRQAGATVRVMPTRGAQAFVTPLTFEALSGRACLTQALQTDDGQIPHVEEAYRADLFVVCPASADLLAKMARGFADEALLATWLSYRGPTIVAPAMETHMWEHFATQTNVGLLAQQGVRFVGPEEGPLASGRTGKGRMASVGQIVEACRQALTPQDGAGRHLLITAGPTVEDIDPVRYLSNRSSGKMGVALATAALRRGAAVTLVHGPLEVDVPSGARLTAVAIRSARQMAEAVTGVLDHERPDAAILCAAVADYRPAQIASSKIKKDRDGLHAIALVENPDILAGIGQRAERPFLVGFAAETDDVEANARQKLTRKGVDLLVANDVSRADSGFGSDTNRVMMLSADGMCERLEALPKSAVAHEILDRIMRQLDARGARWR